LRLVERDGDVEPELRFGLLDGLVKFRVGDGVQPVRRFEQFGPKLFGVVRLGPRRSEPVPQFPFVRLEVIPQLDVIRQRFRNVLRRTHRRVAIVLGIRPKNASVVKADKVSVLQFTPLAAAA